MRTLKLEYPAHSIKSKGTNMAMVESARQMVEEDGLGKGQIM